jgi:DNA invertase Pin-like site-specific DNA recombinase
VLESGGEYDLTTANGRKTFRDQLNAAAYESDRLSTRVKRGKRVKATRGEPNHSWRPFGFEQDGVPAVAPASPMTAVKVLLERFACYLATQRALTSAVVRAYVYWVGPFIEALLAHNPRIIDD